jgi:hypothetical protein
MSLERLAAVGRRAGLGYNRKIVEASSSPARPWGRFQFFIRDRGAKALRQSMSDLSNPSLKAAQARLQAALRFNRDEEARALLASGVDPLMPFQGGLTPLMVAARLGFGACVNLLLPVSDASAVDPAGRTALALAAGGNASADVVGALASAHPELTRLRDALGALPIARAASFGKTDCAMAILAAADGEPGMALEGAAAARAGGWRALAQDLEMAAELAVLEQAATEALVAQKDPSRL